MSNARKCQAKYTYLNPRVRIEKKSDGVVPADSGKITYAAFGTVGTQKLPDSGTRWGHPTGSHYLGVYPTNVSDRHINGKRAERERS